MLILIRYMFGLLNIPQRLIHVVRIDPFKDGPGLVHQVPFEDKPSRAPWDLKYQHEEQDRVLHHRSSLVSCPAPDRPARRVDFHSDCITLKTGCVQLLRLKTWRPCRERHCCSVPPKSI